ncbi:MAG TPA: glycosyl hydrolase family 65 protein, partial [Phycisphaerae bacterium]|nr:glycosyl hydrolase family 65 protein [Phycisphaerae bacterium]
VVPWIDENLDPRTGEWLARKILLQQEAKRKAEGKEPGGIKERGKDYNHSSYCDLIISGLVGLRPRADDTVEANPLVPDGRWDWFCLDNVWYHGRILTIVWDKDGTRYGKGKGLRVLADGREIARSEALGRITGRLLPVPSLEPFGPPSPGR